ncbi:MAG TPA: hypothetical protein ENN22_14915, partial [bacterium]|nr:hypothetical protein [bacterium]
MRYCGSFVVVAILFVLLVSFSKNSSNASGLGQKKRSFLPKNVVEASNRFGMNLYNVIVVQDKDQNVVISPFSISLALMMAANGAAGKTLTEMQKVLQISDISLEKINPTVEKLMTELVKLDPGLSLKIGNSIWFRDDFQFKKTFFEQVKKYYHAELAAMNFDDPASLEQINSWISNATNNKI